MIIEEDDDDDEEKKKKNKGSVIPRSERANNERIKKIEEMIKNKDVEHVIAEENLAIKLHYELGFSFTTV